MAATSSSAVNSGVQKKKRTKVTDTRLSPRVAKALLQDDFYHRCRTSHDVIARKLPHRTPTAADLPVLHYDYYRLLLLLYAIIHDGSALYYKY